MLTVKRASWRQQRSVDEGFIFSLFRTLVAFVAVLSNTYFSFPEEEQWLAKGLIVSDLFFVGDRPQIEEERATTSQQLLTSPFFLLLRSWKKRGDFSPSKRMTPPISIEDVRREVKILKALSNHNNLVKFYDACEDALNVYVVMEGGRYSEEDAKAIVIQILSVIAFCHLQGVVHRDLKPKEQLRALLQNATEAMKESKLEPLSYRKMDFEEFCAAAISPHHLEALDGWEQMTSTAFEHFEREGNRAITVKELA
ncbi:hypothetical protein ZIOFF_038408 [Zingiber officinale]|uniref:Protein kinase domain-containing protein n=1 Tax=Zingiber officinale TaxID=94328 RepID=A0A8J5L2A1_ZINOF|nr:hypothetical protein ZIOFF_038408 [Zingiber officinale]